MHNAFQGGKSITRGVGPWNLRYLWVKLHEPFGECHFSGHKYREFQGPPPTPSIGLAGMKSIMHRAERFIGA